MEIKFPLSTTTFLTRTVFLTLPLAALPLGCQNEETPPPLPTAKPAPSPTTVKLEIAEEDAGSEKEEPKKRGGKGVRRGGPLTACCQALRQNAESQPEPNKSHMKTAAAACDAANAAGTAPAAFAGTLAGLLRGAGAPPACQ